MNAFGRVSREYWALQRQGLFAESLDYLKREAAAGSAEANYELSERLPSHWYDAQQAQRKAQDDGYLPALASAYQHVREDVVVARGVDVRIMTSQCAWSKWVFLWADRLSEPTAHIALLREACATGNVHAIAAYGILVNDAHSLHEAAEAGHAGACMQLAWAQHPDALRYLDMAAAQHSLDACEWLARHYFELGQWRRAARYQLRAWKDSLHQRHSYTERCEITGCDPEQRAQELYVYARDVVLHDSTWLEEGMPPLRPLYTSVTTAARAAAIALYGVLRARRDFNRDMMRHVSALVWQSRHTHPAQWERVDVDDDQQQHGCMTMAMNLFF